MTTRRFERINSDLIKGDILSIMVANPTHKDYGKRCYAICSGSGFGCDMESMGNAIYVDHCSTDLESVIRKRDDNTPRDQDTADRWEKFWRSNTEMQLRRMVEEKVPCEHQNHDPNYCCALLRKDNEGNELSKPIRLSDGCCTEWRSCSHYMERISDGSHD